MERRVVCSRRSCRGVSNVFIFVQGKEGVELQCFIY